MRDALLRRTIDAGDSKRRCRASRDDLITIVLQKVTWDSERKRLELVSAHRVTDRDTATGDGGSRQAGSVERHRDGLIAIG